MKVDIIAYSLPVDKILKNPSVVSYYAAKNCYSPNWKPNQEYLKIESNVRDFLFPILKSGHTSILEHCSVSFNIEGISRACSHQLVRHRLASYTQQSQRYAVQSNDFVVPKTIEANSKVSDVYKNYINFAISTYKQLIEMGVPKEDARFVLPNAVTTKLTMTMNYRALINFLGLRMCTRAQWEIRELATNIFNLLSTLDPVIFGEYGYCRGPKCSMTGFCTEKKSCGKYPRKSEV